MVAVTNPQYYSAVDMLQRPTVSFFSFILV